MKSEAQYKISFSALKLGTHTFDFLAEHSFFQLFPYSPVNEGRVWIHVSMQKHETMLVLDFKINGTVNVLCSRCNEAFDLPIEGNQRLIVKFGEAENQENDDILILPHGEHEVNLAQSIYEFILLCIPIKVEHPSDSNGTSTCDPTVLAVLEKLSVKPESSNDPRWEALKKLKNT